MKSNEMHIGDVILDSSTGTLRLKDGRPAPLRHKSKEVLLHLVANPGRTVTKDELIDSVWANVTVSDDSLVQCIADIRRIIGEDAKEIVETVPREGYRMNLQGRAEPSQRHVRRAPILLGAAVPLVILAAWFLWQTLMEATPPKVLAPGGIATEVGSSASLPGTSNVEAYLELLQGRVSATLFDEEESLLAERHFRRAIELDPNYARAYAELGTLFAVRIENDWTVLKAEDRDKALYYAEKAISLDPDLATGHHALGRLYSVIGKYDTAEAHLRRAMALQPENEDARAYFATVQIFKGNAAGALEILEPTVKSHPNPPYWYYLSLGNAHYELNQITEAEMAFQSCLELAPMSPYCLRFMVAVYAEQGRAADANEARAAYAALGFDASIEAMLALMWFQVPTGEDRLRKAYRSVGLLP